MSAAHSDAPAPAPAPAPATNKRRRVHEPGEETKEGDYDCSHQEWMDRKRIQDCFKWAKDYVCCGSDFLDEDAKENPALVQKTINAVALALFNAESKRIATMFAPAEEDGEE